MCYLLGTLLNYPANHVNMNGVDIVHISGGKQFRMQPLQWAPGFSQIARCKGMRCYRGHVTYGQC